MPFCPFLGEGSPTTTLFQPVSHCEKAGVPQFPLFWASKSCNFVETHQPFTTVKGLRDSNEVRAFGSGEGGAIDHPTWVGVINPSAFLDIDISCEGAILPFA